LRIFECTGTEVLNPHVVLKCKQTHSGSGSSRHRENRNSPECVVRVVALADVMFLLTSSRPMFTLLKGMRSFHPSALHATINKTRTNAPPSLRFRISPDYRAIPPSQLSLPRTTLLAEKPDLHPRQSKRKDAPWSVDETCERNDFFFPSGDMPRVLIRRH
jgi:hypothetical protein